jgi:hypothetical protein
VGCTGDEDGALCEGWRLGWIQDVWLGRISSITRVRAGPRQVPRFARLGWYKMISLVERAGRREKLSERDWDALCTAGTSLECFEYAVGIPVRHSTDALNLKISRTSPS